MRNMISEKLLTLWKIVKFFYGRYTKDALLRDVIFIAVTVAEMLSITIAGKFLDATVNVIENNQTFNIHAYLGTDSFYFLSLGLFLWFIVNIGNKIRQNLYEKINDLLKTDTQLDMLEKISTSNLQDVENPNFQQLQDFIPAYSIDKMMLSYSAFSTIISQMVRLVSAFIIMYTTLGWSVLILVFLPIPEVLLSHFNRKKIQLFTDSQMERLNYISYVNALAQDIEKFPELRVDGTYGWLKKSFGREKYTYLEELFGRRDHFWIDKIFGSVVDQLFKYIYIIYILAYTIIHRLSIGSFSALFNYADVVYHSSFSVFDTLSQLDNRLTYASRFFSFMDFKGFGDQGHGVHKLNPGTPSLEFQNLDFAYPDEPTVKVLENVNLRINPGEKVVFYGGDASGKSSIVKILAGLYEIVAGDYVIGGYSIRELVRGELKRKISVTFQNFVNYNFSIEENITIGSHRKNVDRELYEKVLKVSGVADLIKKEKINDKQVLGKYLDGKELSPGYWQRLAIARMLYRNRDIFIMDEAFTFIDTHSQEKILKDIIKFVGPKRTLIYITRDAHNLELFDRTYHFRKGHVVEVGNVKELQKLA